MNPQLPRIGADFTNIRIKRLLLGTNSVIMKSHIPRVDDIRVGVENVNTFEGGTNAHQPVD